MLIRLAEKEAILNKIEGHESGLPDLLIGKPVTGQIWSKPKTAYRKWDPEIWKWAREKKEAIQLTGFRNRLAGFENHKQIWFSGFVPAQTQSKFGFPNWRTGKPVMMQRRSLANPVIRISTRELQNEKQLCGWLEMIYRLSLGNFFWNFVSS